MQALEKKAGRTTQYHPGFAITSAQLLRAIDELEVGTSSGELKSILQDIYEIIDKDTDNITEPVTIADVSKAISDLGSDLTSILEELYKKIDKNFGEVTGTVTTKTISDAIDEIKVASSLEIYDEQ